MSDPFDEPGALESLKWADIDGRLLLITPLETKHDVPNLDGNGVRDVIIADVAILDGPGAPEEWTATPIYPRYIGGQLRGNVGSGRSNLGRVGQDTSRQKRGQSAPWVLGSPTEADKGLARQYLATKATTKARVPATRPATGASTTTFTDEPPF